MSSLLFILQPGIWIGEGKISFSASPDFIKFYTKWEVKESQPGHIKAKQVVEMQGIDEHVINFFEIREITERSFFVELESEAIGHVTGSGIFDEKMIAWEFRNQDAFEGFEVYELQENGDFLFHAEYASEQFRTLIDGLVWKKG